VHNNLYSHFLAHFDQAPVSIERLQATGRWLTHLSRHVSDPARTAVLRGLPRLQERDNRWITLASNACGLAARDVGRNVAMGGDDMLLATLICISRRAVHSCEYYMLGLVEALTQFDIRHTPSALQHDFCAFWNELVLEASNKGTSGNPTQILRRIRRLYITLHQGTDAAPTAFFASTRDLDLILELPSSYPLCEIASHRYSTAHVPDLSSRAVSAFTRLGDSSDASPNQSNTTISRQAKEAIIVSGSPSPSHPTTPSEIGDTGNSQVPTATSPASPVHTSPHPTDASPSSAPLDIPSAATLYRPLEGTTLKDIVAPCTEPDASEILSTASTPALISTPAPLPGSTPRVLNRSPTYCDADAASTSNPLLPGFFVSASSPPSRVSPLPNAELLSLLDGTTPSRPIGNAALPCLRVRGLVNTGSMCFVNTVFQLLVNSPPLWNLFRQLGDLKGQRGTGCPESGGGATPLVDATIRLFDEFMNKEEEPPPTRRQPRQIAGGKPREGEEAKEPDVVDSFEPTYVCNAMKEKTQLKSLLVRSHAM
jgi:hypothetical protein